MTRREAINHKKRRNHKESNEEVKIRMMTRIEETHLKWHQKSS